MSNVSRREERQSSPSFDWMHQLQTEAYHNEQAEISGQQCRAYRDVGLNGVEYEREREREGERDN